MTETRTGRPRLLLALGAAAGLGLAALDLLAAPHGSSLPSDAVARVDGVLVERAEYERALAALAADRRTPLSDADRRRVLDRLIDEELLVQRGLALGLAQRDRRVRADIVAAMIESALADAAAREPTDEELQRFYEENRDLLVRPGRVRARQIVVRVSPSRSDDAARARAQEVRERLARGEDFATVAGELGDPPVAELPAAPLDAGKLRDYVGPTVARAILEQPVGTPSEPVRSASGYHVVEVLEREADTTPPLAEIEDVVRSELRRQQENDALRAYLERLREEAEIVVREPAS